MPMFRYWAVTQAHYIHSRNTRNICLMICLVWVISVVVSLAPLLGWKDGNWSERVEAGDCMVREHEKSGYYIPPPPIPYRTYQDFDFFYIYI